MGIPTDRHLVLVECPEVSVRFERVQLHLPYLWLSTV